LGLAFKQLAPTLQKYFSKVLTFPKSLPYIWNIKRNQPLNIMATATKLSKVEQIAKGILTAKTHKTAAKYGNMRNELSEADSREVGRLCQVEGREAMIGHYAINKNSYLLK
jgi:hypothetical protein